MTKRTRQTNDEAARLEMELLAGASEDDQRRLFANSTPAKLLEVDAHFEHWAHKNQLPPDGEGWRTWLMMAGRGFGKTRAGAEWIFRLGEGRPGSLIALVGANIDDARMVMIEGVSGLLAVARRHRRRLKWEPSLGRLSWPNGSKAQLFSGDNPDGLRGPEHDFAWVLTFEVIADDSDPGIEKILGDAARGAIAASSSETVIGYAAYGQSMKSAAKPLVDAFGLELFDDGTIVRGPLSSAPLAIADGDLGNSADGERVSRIYREQSPVGAVPAALRLGYYDPDRDYQSGEARASAGEQGGPERSAELAAVIDAASAKGIVNASLARSWAQRDKLTLRLPPRFIALEPGSIVTVPLSPAEWIVETCAIDGFVVSAELRPAVRPGTALAAQGGRIIANSTVVQGPLTLALFDAPDILGQPQSGPTLMLAASTPSPGWKRRTVSVAVAGHAFSCRVPARKSVLGQTLDAVPAGDPYLIDAINSFEIQLVDEEQWLSSRDDEALANGANLAFVGRELIQFGDALPTGVGRFRLSRLVRGCGGTEWAIADHQLSEPFALAIADALTALALPPSTIGATAVAVPPSGGSTSLAVGGEALRPPAPVALDAAIDGAGTLSLRWTRRSRHGWAWRDEVEVPIGETVERYAVRVIGTAGVVEASCTEPQSGFSAAELAQAGPGPASIEVRQIGDFAASRPVGTTVTLP